MSTVNEIVRSHNIFIKSKNKNPSDYNYCFTINLPEGEIKVDKPGNQVIRLTLSTLSVPYSWPQINQTNNMININDIYNNNQKNIILPQGIYSYPQLCTTINNLWGSTIVSFDINQLKFYFAWKTIIKLTFFQNSCYTFGFNPSDSGITGQSITSTNVLNEKQLNNIYVTLDDVIQEGRSTNFDNNNVNDTKLKQSNILCQIPIDIEPWGILYYKNAEHSKLFSLDLSLLQLNNLTISIRDVDGNYLLDFPNFECVLKAEIVNKMNTDNKVIISGLKYMNESLSTLKMMKFLKNKAYYRLK